VRLIPRRSLTVAAGAALVIVAAWPVAAQVAVTDPAVTIRNAITAAFQELIVNAQRQQHEQIERMARRLTFVTDLATYALTDTPEWRIHDFFTDAVRFARAYHAALTYGDGTGSAYLAVTTPLLTTDDEGFPPGMNAPSWQTVRARLATVNVADAVAIAATNDTGLLRYNGRRDQAAIDALEAQVTDSSHEQSTTAILEKVSGAVLVGVRQRQARAAFIAGILEQLLVDTKRARDTEAAAINMQLTTWRDGAAANTAFHAGTGDALTVWRQP
jgi:hypothetical protein